MVRDIYLKLSLEEREHFDQKYTSVFFTHAATQPAINAEKILALMQCGLVEVVKLGDDYQFVKNDTKGAYDFHYLNSARNQQRDTYTYVVDARGQAKSIQTDSSLFMKNLLRRGIVQIEETQPIQPGGKREKISANHQQSNFYLYKTGSIWIDPQTHRIIRRVSANKINHSKTIYAVGAMTRGQIIDASMARGIVQSTAVIADSLIKFLRNRN